MFKETSSGGESPEYLPRPSLVATRSKGMVEGRDFVSRLPSAKGYPQWAVLAGTHVVARQQHVPFFARWCTTLVVGAYDPPSGGALPHADA